MSTKETSTTVDCNKFRLRRFMDHLATIGELEVHPEPLQMTDITALIENSPKAVLFKNVGPQKYEMFAGFIGNRRRLAAAFGLTDTKKVLPEYMRRLQNPQKVAEVPSAEAPVHQVVLKGEDIDLTQLPFYLQHQLDGAPYISAAMDYTINPADGKPNVGCRRLMLRSKKELRCNLTQMSDLKRIYVAAVERNERLPLSFVIGAHPLDFMSAAIKVPMDEFQLVATLRGETLPMVRGITNGIPVPADAEMVLEGYLDELGYAEKEGPYGELYGYYGPMHDDPVFHVTAITHRRDMLNHTVLHGGPEIRRNDASLIGGLSSEARVLQTLKAAGFDVTDVHCPESATGLHICRVALKQKAAGDARHAIEALFKMPLMRLIYIVDPDVDVHSHEAMDWAQCTRFRADRDIHVEAGHFALTMDPTNDAEGKMVKVGYDFTEPFDAPERIENKLSFAPSINLSAKKQSITQALASGPKHFYQLMEAAGTTDGRAVTLELDDMRAANAVGRTPDGLWCLAES